MSDGFSVLFQQARTYCPASRDIIEIKDDDRSGTMAKRSARGLVKGTRSQQREREFDLFVDSWKAKSRPYNISAS